MHYLKTDKHLNSSLNSYFSAILVILSLYLHYFTSPAYNVLSPFYGIMRSMFCMNIVQAE